MASTASAAPSEAWASLTLDEAALARTPESGRASFLYSWLRHLDRVLPIKPRPDIKANQKTLVNQLMELITKGTPGPPARVLIAQCMTTLFRVGDTFMLFETINSLNDLLKNKDDSPSYLPTRLASITVLGNMYASLGRMTGRSYEETAQLLTKGLKNAESQTRMETMVTLGKICQGLGSAAGSIHRDIFKAVRSSLSDRGLGVRSACAACLAKLSEHAAFVASTAGELETTSLMCFRAMEGANYETRKAVAKCLGTIMANTQIKDSQSKGLMRTGMMVTSSSKKGGSASDKNKQLPLEDVLNILIKAF